MTGGKIGDIIGRRRAFSIGLVIYGCGSAMTAVAPTVGIPTLGWSILEGLGAALVLPALAALIAGNFEGKSRATAYAVIGGVAGAGSRWTDPRRVGDDRAELARGVRRRGPARDGHPCDDEVHPRCGREGNKPKLDFLGTVLSASGLGLIVLGTLQSSVWG